MSDDWFRALLELVASLASGAVGIVLGVWKAGRASVKREQAVKDDYTMKIRTMEQEMRTALAHHEKASEARLDTLVDQFQESFTGLRRQIDNDRLHTEREFMRKEDFKDFRDEYREDMREIKAKIDAIKTTAN
jgi:hypothetical protein